MCTQKNDKSLELFWSFGVPKWISMFAGGRTGQQGSELPETCLVKKKRSQGSYLQCSGVQTVSRAGWLGKQQKSEGGMKERRHLVTTLKESNASFKRKKQPHKHRTSLSSSHLGPIQQRAFLHFLWPQKNASKGLQRKCFCSCRPTNECTASCLRGNPAMLFLQCLIL